MSIKERFRGFLPIIIDVETGGFDPKKNALLELAAVNVKMNENGMLEIGDSIHFHVEPFEGSKIEQESLQFTGIDPSHPFRFAVSETEGFSKLQKWISEELKKTKCQRAVLVGHNAWFDLLFVNEALKRAKVKSPFHAFTCFDTATLSALACGQTVLAKAAKKCGLSFDPKEAHSALYDATVTAELFCKIVNTTKKIF